MGVAFNVLGKDDEANVAYKDALKICTTMSTQDTQRYNELMAETLANYCGSLVKLHQFSEAAAVAKQGVSLCRHLAQTGHECTRILCECLHYYGGSSY